jgi:hypothetical protein
VIVSAAVVTPVEDVQETAAVEVDCLQVYAPMAVDEQTVSAFARCGRQRKANNKNENLTIHFDKHTCRILRFI